MNPVDRAWSSSQGRSPDFGREEPNSSSAVGAAPLTSLFLLRSDCPYPIIRGHDHLPARLPHRVQAVQLCAFKSLSSKAVTCLTLGENGNSLASGSEDGMVRVWDTKTRNIVRIFKHGKGPINNVIVAKKSLPLNSCTSQAFLGKKHGSLLPPPLGRYADSNDDSTDVKVFIASTKMGSWSADASYGSEHVVDKEIGELQLGSAASSEMENGRLKLECQKSMQLVEQWKKMYDELHEHYLNELVNGNTVEGSNGISA